MSTTTDTPQPVTRRTPPPVALAAPRTARRPALIALGIAMTVVAALGAAFAVNATSGTQEAIALARTVPQGAIIERADLTTANVRPDAALAPMSVRHIPTVVGQRATTTLLAGSLLTPDAYTDTDTPPKGKALVGLTLKQAAMPSEGLEPGDPVRIVAVPQTQDETNTGPTGETSSGQLYDNSLPVVPGAVASVTQGGPDGDTTVTVVNVLVAPAASVGLAARAAVGGVAVIVDTREK